VIERDGRHDLIRTADLYCVNPPKVGGIMELAGLGRSKISMRGTVCENESALICAFVRSSWLLPYVCEAA